MSSSRGWILILTGLLVSSFFGGAVHVLFSPDRVSEYVQSLVNQYEPRFSIQFQSANLRLAEGWRPLLAIELDGLKIKAKDPCITNSVITTDRLIVPLQIFPFLMKRVRFGEIAAGHLQFIWRPPSCSGKPAFDYQGVDKIASLERFFQDRWNIEIVNTTHYLEALKVRQLDLSLDGAQTIMTANDFRIDFDADDHRALVRTNLRLGSPWIGHVRLGTFRVGAEVKADQVRVGARGNLKEGQITVNSNWHVETGNLHVSGEFADLPIQGVVDLTRQWGAFKNFQPQLHDEWLTCKLGFDGDIRAFYTSPLKVTKCGMYGDLGSWALQTTSVLLSNPFPLKWMLQNIDVQKWLASLGIGPNWGVIANYGKFTGHLTLQGANQFTVGGGISGLSAFLTSARDRAKQKFRAINVKMAYDGARVSGTVDRFQVEDGELKGAASFDLSESGTGTLNLDFSQISLPSPVQKVIWGGLAPSATLNGQGELNQLQLSTFDGHLNLQSLETYYWKMKKIDSKLRLQNGTWHIQARADQFSLRPESKWQGFVNNIAAAIRPPPPELKLEHLTTDADINEFGGHWSNFNAHLPKSRARIFSMGGWDAQTGLTGQVIVHNESRGRVRKLSAQSFTIGGNWGDPQIKVAGAQ